MKFVVWYKQLLDPLKIL